MPKRRQEYVRTPDANRRALRQRDQGESAVERWPFIRNPAQRRVLAAWLVERRVGQPLNPWFLLKATFATQRRESDTVRRLMVTPLQLSVDTGEIEVASRTALRRYQNELIGDLCCHRDGHE